MKLVRAAKTGYIAASIAGIIIGTILIVWPQLSANVICCIVGAVILLSGVVKLVGYFSNDLYRLAFQYDLALGILTMLLGLLMIVKPAWFSAFLVTAAGIYVIVNALFTLQTAVEAKGFGLRHWWLLLICAAISAVLGVLLLLKPFESVAAITVLVGVALIADGLQNLLVAALTIRIRKSEEDAQFKN